MSNEKVEIKIKPEQFFGIPDLNIFYWLSFTARHDEGVEWLAAPEPDKASIIFVQGNADTTGVAKYSLPIPQENYLGTSQYGEPVKLSAELLEKPGKLEVLQVSQIPV